MFYVRIISNKFNFMYRLNDIFVRWKKFAITIYEVHYGIYKMALVVSR